MQTSLAFRSESSHGLILRYRIYLVGIVAS
jgi:hypothetical protein